VARPTNLKLHKFSNESFINGCYIPENICDDLITYFDNNPERQTSGQMFNETDGNYVDTNRKDSLDISFWIYQNQKDAQILSRYFFYLDLCRKEYEYKYDRVKYLAKYNIDSYVNIQKYEPSGGYKKWHCERAGFRDANRCLAFMTYLNNVSDGGTDFKYQKTTAPAKKGLTLIWPSDWTHTHKGQVSHTQQKYIITGWYNYIE
tara:strand:- start:810 stop:1421 length:612 start_codon:yes stop_codon:yes gene_type:complete